MRLGVLSWIIRSNGGPLSMTFYEQVNKTIINK